MIILKEELVMDVPLTEELDPNDILSEVKYPIDEWLEGQDLGLRTELASQNILRVYYDKKSLLSVQPDVDDEKIFVIEDYKGNVTTALNEEVVEIIKEILMNLNYVKKFK